MYVGKLFTDMSYNNVSPQFNVNKSTIYVN